MLLINSLARSAALISFILDHVDRTSHLGQSFIVTLILVQNFSNLSCHRHISSKLANILVGLLVVLQ